MTKSKEKKELDSAVEEDPLIQGLLAAQGRKVELVAFGVSYVGMIESVDIDLGVVVVSDGENRAMIEIERVESLTMLSS